ncbi:MAG: hypothetical protein K940chlam2_00003 [Chlamydiae bacterium]|nr:hypothetical protein [Chlamydiota bacterium]
MPANEALEVMYIEIDAKMDPFISGVRKGVEDAGKETAKTAQQIGLEFAAKFVEAFNKDLSAGLGPDLQDFLKKAVSRMKLENLGFAEALAVEFEAAAQEGKVLNMTFQEITAEVKRLEEVLIRQADEVMPDVIRAIAEHKKITEEDAEAIRRRLVEVRAGVEGTEEFRAKLGEFVQAEVQVESASKKKTRAIKDQTASVKDDARAMDGVSKAASRLVKRFAIMFIGVHAVRQALNALKRVMRESLAVYMETIESTSELGKIMSFLDKQTLDAQLQIGRIIGPFNLLGKALKTIALQLFAILLQKLIDIGVSLIKTVIILVSEWKAFGGVIELAALSIKQVFVGAFLALIEVAQVLLRAIKPITDFLGGDIARAANEADAAMEELQLTIAKGADEWKTAEEIMRGMKDTLQAGQDAAESFQEEWENLVALFPEADRFQLMATRLKAAMEKILEAAEEASAKAMEQLTKRMDDITLRMTRRRADAQRDLLRDLADIERDSYEDRVKASMDFQEKSFRLEEDFLMKMTELEENFIFEIEDAVRERDARGVLNAQRKFNLAKQQLEREKNLRTKRLIEDFKNELKEIEREREIRRAETLMEYNQQLLDFDEQEQRLRDDAALQFRRRMAQINDQINARLKLLVEGFNAELNLTNQELNALYDAYLAAYGPNGYITAVYRYFQSVISGGGTTTFPEPDPDATPLQRGGSIIATSPTTLLVGEGTPERVDVTPLSRSTGAPRAGFGGGGLSGGGEGRVIIDVNMGHGLVGEVIDEAMEEIAGVITRISEGGTQ